MNFVTRDARLQDPKNRQNSIDVDDIELHDIWDEKQKNVLRASRDAYQWAIDNGVAKEVARGVLPEGMMESVLIMSGSLRSWVHYCQIRMDKATQKEHRIVAEQCWEIIGERFPDIIEALKDE